MTRRKYRSQAGIILDILDSLYRKGPMNATRLGYSANLPYDRLKEILAVLQRKGYVAVAENGQLTITREGIRALQRLMEARMLLESLGYRL